MRLSTSTNVMCFDRGQNYAVSMGDSIRACKIAGYQYLDANLCSAGRKGQPLSGDRWEDWAKECRELADSLGMKFTQAHGYFPLSRDVGADGKEYDYSYCEEMMHRSVLAAEILGAPWMVVHPFTVKNEAGYSYRKSFRDNKQYFSEWLEIFSSHHVKMAIENMASFGGVIRYGTVPDELMELVDAIGTPDVGICVDTGHAHLAGYDVAGYIRTVSQYLHAMHIADNHKNIDEHFAPFNGTINWKSVMRALTECAYQDDFSFEIHHLASFYPRQVQQEMVNFSYRLGLYLMDLAGEEECD